MTGSGPEGTADPASDRELLIAVDDAWSIALMTNDTDRMGGVMADEWVIVSGAGLRTKESFLELVRSGELTHSAMERVSEARVRFYGEARDTAVLTSRVINTAHWRGGRFEADEWTTSVFVRRDGDWLCVLSQITEAGDR